MSNFSAMAPHKPEPDALIETTFLIVGAGPSGAALACFLASYGLHGIVISAAGGTAQEPRAHITNPAALECLRDIGLEAAAVARATSNEHMQHTRWCHDMAGVEFARIHAWGHQPHRRGAYAAASPYRHVDLPQTLLEPLLVQHAASRGWRVRFDSEFVSYVREEKDVDDDDDDDDDDDGRGKGSGKIISTIRDRLSGRTYAIRSTYLFGCDGARSQVLRQLGLPLIKAPGQGLAINLLVDADLSAHVRHRVGNLHWCFTPELEHPAWGWSGIARMVKPWREWMFIIFPEPGFEDFGVQPTKEEYEARVRQFIGDDSIPVKLLHVSKWNINETVAERYSDGNIFCLGDAVHRHPPLNGLGSNTCVQDAWNLAWKLAFVERGIAHPSLLATYSAERQPIGAGLVKRANQALRDHLPIWEALGVLPRDVEERKKQHAELSASTQAGRDRRKRLREAIAGTEHEFGGIGIEMNQRYVSPAIDIRDEGGIRPPVPENEVLENLISTYPGSRLPHAWLNKRSPEEAISTIDLAGHGAFCLLIGIGGEKWREAVDDVGWRLGVPLNVYSIGWMQDWEDVYGDWAQRKEVEEDGCILVRPDRTICWRSMTMRDDCKEALLRVLKAILGKE